MDVVVLPAAHPDVDQHEMGALRVPNLDVLARIKLTAFRERTQRREASELAVVDESWVARLQPEPAARLLLLLDTPER